MGVVADRGYYYRGVLRGGRDFLEHFLVSSDSPCGYLSGKGERVREM